MTEPFISVGALGDGFEADANLLPPTTELTGRQFTTDLPGIDRLTFGDGTLSWGSSEIEVRATSIRPGIFFVDGVDGEVSTTFVIDVDAQLVTMVRGTLPDLATRAESAWTRVQRGDEPTGVKATFSHGHLDSGRGALHSSTEALIGLRNRYTYSPTEQYEHVYFSPTNYAWHCVRGVERDLADVDACHHVGLRPGLTLFSWREKIVPTLGVILIDLDHLKTDGKIFGNHGFDTDSIVNFPVGAVAEVLNHTDHSPTPKGH